MCTKKRKSNYSGVQKIIGSLFVCFFAVVSFGQEAKPTLKLIDDSLFIFSSGINEFTGTYKIKGKLITLNEDARIIVNAAFVLCSTNESFIVHEDSIYILTELLLPNSSSSIYPNKLLYVVN